MLRYYGDPRAVAIKLDPEPDALAKTAETEQGVSGRSRTSAVKKSSLRELYDDFVVAAEVKKRFSN